MNVTVIKVDFQGLKDLSKALDSKELKEKIAEESKWIIGNYLRRHYQMSSEGNGNWKPLNRATIRNRKPPARIGTKNKDVTDVKRAFDRRASILKDTGQLFAALDPRLENPPGREEIVTIENGKMTLEFGYGGNDLWDNGELPEFRKKKKNGEPRKERKPITISALASIHHYGVPGRIPARPMVVPLDDKTTREIEDMIEEVIWEEAK